MNQLSMEHAQSAVGASLVDRNGDKVGKVEDIYLDQDTRQPEWALVNTGMFGARQSFVPLANASFSGEQLMVGWEKSQIKDAPHAEPDGELSQDEEARLYQHYGLAYSDAPSDSGLPTGGTRAAGATEAGDTGHDTSGPNTDSAMTRSEEELRVGTVRRPSELVRLRKYIVTENVQTTVPVSREEVRVEREPITEANIGKAMEGPDLSTEEHELTLNEEQVVVSKQVVPKERVRLDKDVVTEQETVNEEIRKEQIDVERGGRTVDADTDHSA
jgi:uncharacterized protein (TIGR02271 family)